MADVMIAIVHFPNDPTKNNIAHQMYVAMQTSEKLNLYSISSILGKEKRVYGSDSDNYITILPPEDKENGFKVPSFIDCTKMYQIAIDGTINLSALTQRLLAPQLKKRIDEKIAEMKQKGKHFTYNISTKDFKSWNPKI